MQHDLFVFDLDGTLVMSEHIHYECWNLILGQMASVNLSYDEFCSIFHTSVEGGIEIYLRDTLRLSNYAEVIAMKNELYIEVLKNSPEKFALNKGCLDLLHRIVSSGKPFVIVTNSRRRVVDAVVSHFPILTMSSRTYCREDILRPKPNSACYDQVLTDFPCERPIIFEDSITGIIAASGVRGDIVFVTSPSYVHYNTVIARYHPAMTIADFVGLDEKLL
jgi:beta-phosphoglucomutase-like phosphatase (HAD superfamily)